MAAIASELMARAGTAAGMAKVRLAVTGGSGPLTRLAAGADRTVWMTAVPFAAGAGPLALAVSPWPRNERSAIAGLKCASYAENLVALDHARRAGCAEILFFNTAGELCEAATANVFLVRNGRLSTPSLASGCLPGIGRQVMLEAAARHGIACAEATLTADDLAAADEVILTSALRGPVAAGEVAGRPLPSAPLAARLRELWWNCVRSGVASP
jgi:branched-subunit amino acid aminotransferase/4-amino-4-deoxychorismate lyase